MNVKKYSMFFSHLLRNKGRIPICSFYCITNNLQKVYKARHTIHQPLCKFSSKNQNNKKENEICEIRKKIELTNFKLADSSYDYISSDDSDEEEYKWKEEKSTERKLETCEHDKSFDATQRYNQKILNHGNQLHNCLKQKHIFTHDGGKKNNGIHEHHPENYSDINLNDKNEDVIRVTSDRRENHSVDLNQRENKIIWDQINTSNGCTSVQEMYSDEFSSIIRKNDGDKEYEQMKFYLNSYIKRKKESENNMTECHKNESSTSVLNEELHKLEISLRPSQNDINNIKTFINFLQNEINKHYKNCHVTPFGSIINGFWMRNSDIDICIQIPVLLSRKDQIIFLKKICLILNSFNDGIIEQRFSAKVPIIHFYCKNPRHSFELSCDISVNNILAVINSKLIQKYVSIDKRLQIMGIALKHWLKNRNINDRSKGFLSSFSLILMIIHFLQYVIEPRILTSLQDISFRRNEKPFYVMGVDCKYCQDENIIRDELRKINNYNDTYICTSKLLIEFFKFFGYKYKSGIIAIRDINDYYQNFQALKNFESYFLFVDNPFEVGKNVANILPQNYKTIVNEMKRAYKILKNNGSWRDVCGAENQFTCLKHL
ncbi:hypothetical protein, conserved [Plasmodium gonderi]|uniref:Poly(A) RNA polymerase mitochondrial-like central palm domain-containing protein n=1 Tax=Plasmodium gonderi TaxID=77519 RepID=A0A1Y1JG00_PLAGO|nr:hypothetical protein, conserved [Plasmodium gonderi]GAW80578.1 hypothetical protein, conserved [Plasmodium gonderi]